MEPKPRAATFADLEWRRHPADLARLLAAAVVTLFLLGLAATAPEALTNLSGDLVELLARLPVSIRDALAGIAQLLVVIAPVVTVAWLAFRRQARLLGVQALAALSAAGAMSLLVDWLERVAPPSPGGDPQSFLFDADVPSAAYVAALAAAVAVTASILGPRWRRAAWSGVALTALLRLLTATQVPVNVGVAVALGVACGSAVVAILGAPARRLRAEDVASALVGVGLPGATVTLEQLDHRVDIRATTDRGPVRITWLDRDDRDADLLYRAWRTLRVRDAGEELTSSSPRRQAENEAMVTLFAAACGIPTPSILAVGPTDDDSALLAIEDVPGTRLLDLDEEAVSDRLLRDAWELVRVLHEHRIAHRSLRADRFLVEGGRIAALTGLRTARTGAADELLHADIAELLVSSAVQVGAPRAVAAAVAVLPVDLLSDALPLVQDLALTRTTRQRIKADKQLVSAVRATLADQTGADDVELAPIERIGWASIASLAGLVVLLAVGLAFIANLDTIIDQLSEADLTRAPAIMVLIALTYVAGALSLMGSVVRPLPLGPTSILMLAQSFLNRFTPANAGGMAMRVRYLQKGGTDVELAAMSVGLTSLASGVMQGALILVMVLWAGSSPGGAFSFPDIQTVTIVVLGLSALVGLLFAVPRARQFAQTWLSVTWTKLRGQFRDLGRRPDKLALLFGGAGLSKLLTIGAFIMSARAVGIELGTAELAALYVAGNTVGSAVPTPGGVGGIEAALIAVLTGAGVMQATAGAAVILFRLISYWLPVPFGYAALRYSRRTELV